MEIADFISKQKSPLQTFLEQLQQGKKNKFKQQELDDMAKYREGELGIRQQALDQAQEFQPLKFELLKAQIESARAAAKYKSSQANMAGGLTKANVTKNQGIIQAIDNVTPLIDEISDEKYDVPNQLYGPYLHPDQQKNYAAKTAAITDSLISAMGLPKTNESIHLAGTMVQRGKAESLSAYRTRMSELKKDLSNRKQRAHQSIKSGFLDSDMTDTAGATEGAADFNYDENGNQLGS